MVKTKNQKTILIGIAVFVVIASLVYYFNTETVATSDYGITDANIECDGELYIFTGTFNTWRVGAHQVQVFCDDDPSNHILNFYEEDISSSGSYDWHVSRYIDDFNSDMPCTEVWFQLYDSDASTVFLRTETESIPVCHISTPTPTPTASPTPDPTIDPSPDTTEGDRMVLGGVAAFVLLIYFAFIKKPPTTPRSKK